MSDDGRFGVDLRLAADRPPVLNGRDGFSQKGLQAGNASHYYSLTRMKTTGELRLEGETVSVAGLSWMDHEFGTTFLEPSQQGWDWFSLQLDDGTDVMVYVLRQQDGAVDAHSSGTLVRPNGQVVPLTAEDIELVPGPASGCRLRAAPGIRSSGWSGSPVSRFVSKCGPRLTPRSSIRNSRTGVTYWEGAVIATGTWDGEPVAGRGYLEMTGYAGRPMSEVLR